MAGRKSCKYNLRSNKKVIRRTDYSTELEGAGVGIEVSTERTEQNFHGGQEPMEMIGNAASVNQSPMTSLQSSSVNYAYSPAVIVDSLSHLDMQPPFTHHRNIRSSLSSMVSSNASRMHSCQFNGNKSHTLMEGTCCCSRIEESIQHQQASDQIVEDSMNDSEPYTLPLPHPRARPVVRVSHLLSSTRVQFGEDNAENTDADTPQQNASALECTASTINATFHAGTTGVLIVTPETVQSNSQAVENATTLSIPKIKISAEMRQFDIPRKAFRRVVVDIFRSLGFANYSIQMAAFDCLQVGSELFLTNWKEDRFEAAQHAGRMTLRIEDVNLYRKIKTGNGEDGDDVVQASLQVDDGDFSKNCEA